MPYFQSSSQISDIIADLPSVDGKTQNKAASRQAELTKPPGSLGRLEEVAIWMAGWQRRDRPAIEHGQCLIFAGNHGVVAQGISPFPAEVTAQMVANFANGGAAINQLCNLANLKLDVIPLELDRPTNDLSLGPAMSEDETIAAMNIGAEALDDRLRLSDRWRNGHWQYNSGGGFMPWSGLAPMPQVGLARERGLMMMASNIRRK